ncbi:protein CASC3 [Clonorchis sinensis]|uniref:Protein CASC3 n=1 Tax=Clonorchis sinensis TaxID=79923 RepID=H2KSZ7_CLOSI|nr:protein CASC3 [Clonorchis sinensis]
MWTDARPQNIEFDGLQEGQSSKRETRAIAKPALGIASCIAAAYSAELTNLRDGQNPTKSPNVAPDESDEKVSYNLSVDSSEVKSLQVLCCSSLRRLHVVDTSQDSATHESAYLPPHSPSTSAVKSKLLQDIPQHLDQSFLGREEEGQSMVVTTDETEAEYPRVFEGPVATQVGNPNSLQPPCNESASVLSVPDSDNMVVDHDESSSDILDDDDGLLGSRLRAHPSEESDSPSEDDSLYSEISHKSTSQYTDAVDIGIGTSDSRTSPATKEVTSRNLSPELTQANEREAADSVDVDERLDADQDKANPAYIPRTGTYFMHDYRSSENSTTSPQADSQKSRADRSKWQHDMFRYYEQGPRSSRELIMRYGYDIREGNADSNSGSNAPENEPRSPSVSAEHPINREPLTTKPTSPPIHADTVPHNSNSGERDQSHISHGRPRRQNLADYQRQTKRMDPNSGHTRGRFTRSLGIRHQFEQNEIPSTVSQSNEVSQNQFPKSRLQDETGYYRRAGNRGRGVSRNANFTNATSTVSDSTVECPTIRNDDPCVSDDRSNKVVSKLSYSSSPGKAPHVGPRSRGGWTPVFSHRNDNIRVGTASKRYSAFRQATSTTTSVDPSELTSRQTFTDPGLGTRIVAYNFGDHKFSELSRSHTRNSSIPAVPENPDLYGQTRPLQCPGIQHPNYTRLVQDPSFHQVGNSRSPFRPFTTGKDNQVPQAYAAASRESYPVDHLEFSSTECSTYHKHERSEFECRSVPFNLLCILQLSPFGNFGHSADVFS